MQMAKVRRKGRGKHRINVAIARQYATQCKRCHQQSARCLNGEQIRTLRRLLMLMPPPPPLPPPQLLLASAAAVVAVVAAPNAAATITEAS